MLIRKPLGIGQHRDQRPMPIAQQHPVLRAGQSPVEPVGARLGQRHRQKYPTPPPTPRRRPAGPAARPIPPISQRLRRGEHIDLDPPTPVTIQGGVPTPGRHHHPPRRRVRRPPLPHITGRLDVNRAPATTSRYCSLATPAAAAQPARGSESSCPVRSAACRQQGGVLMCRSHAT
ncbi:hypothetical protein BJ998_007843 [Kutzneria kofuensis]|uniref:Uncharacterized protein n=1 Tax=Kutzneria kofuensis TaxID=103725 RepID=A0A7W9NKH5_9PSEU|nr:hypothetical protein [Kutzneria kofuensis]